MSEYFSKVKDRAGKGEKVKFSCIEEVYAFADTLTSKELSRFAFKRDFKWYRLGQACGYIGWLE